jgi:hypothetical protein
MNEQKPLAWMDEKKPMHLLKVLGGGIPLTYLQPSLVTEAMSAHMTLLLVEVYNMGAQAEATARLKCLDGVTNGAD